MGDRILKVNNKELDGCTHQEAVMGLLEPQDTITLSIQHDPLPDGYKVHFLLLLLALCTVTIRLYF
jgi:PDZ domain